MMNRIVGARARLHLDCDSLTGDRCDQIQLATSDTDVAIDNGGTACLEECSGDGFA